MGDPGGILGEIVARKRADVRDRLAGLSLDNLRARAQPTQRSLRAALAQPRARFVMEVKRASPSGGAIRPDADPAVIARAYAGVADAISVLTDTPYFGGSLDDLDRVRARFDGPILAKDFVIDPRQVAEARIHGADAVLAMLSVLDDAEAAAVLREAQALGMDVLVETHDETELRRAVALGAPLIGVNNRDLRSLKVDLAVTERLAPLAPADCVLVAESGVGDRADVERLAPHVDAFLVGSSLMRAANPAQAARALAFGWVKVCGLTNDGDTGRAVSSGAAYAGLVLAPDTPRAVSLTQAEPLAETARDRGAAVVGVFRDAELSLVALAAQVLMLDAVQLHGREDAGYIAALRRALPEGVEIWAATPVGQAAALQRPGADRTVFDTETSGRSGGTGVTFDWSRIADRDDLSSGLLAGGLAPENAAAAARVGAFALDVGSGVEATPGRKDPQRMTAFFEALRPATRQEIAPCA